MKRTLVFAFVCFTWVFFRAETLDDALLIIAEIASFELENPNCPLLALALILMVWSYQLLLESPSRRLLELPPVKVALAAAMIIYLVLVPSSSDAPFIYFQF